MTNGRRRLIVLSGRWLVLLLLFAVASVVSGCTSEGTTCTNDVDCPYPQACINGQCVGGTDAGQDGNTGQDNNGSDQKVDGGNDGGGDQGQQNGVEVVRAAFGSGPNDIGIDNPDQGAQEGPMSFALASTGEIYILDQVNFRVQEFSNGIRNNTIPLPTDPTFWDIDVTKDANLALLDNSTTYSVYLIDPGGNVLATLPLAGRNVPSGGAVYGVYCRDDGIWVEVEGRSVRIADLAGNPDSTRVSVTGDYIYDSSRLIDATVLGDVTADIRISNADFVTWHDYLEHFDSLLGGIDGLGADQSGNILFTANLTDEAGMTSANLGVILDSSGTEKERINMFVSTRIEQVYRNVRISQDGRIYQMELDDQGVAVRRYDP